MVCCDPWQRHQLIRWGQGEPRTTYTTGKKRRRYLSLGSTLVGISCDNVVCLQCVIQRGLNHLYRLACLSNYNAWAYIFSFNVTSIWTHILKTLKFTREVLKRVIVDKIISHQSRCAQACCTQKFKTEIFCLKLLRAAVPSCGTRFHWGKQEWKQKQDKI